jgi:hypothetical protein
MELATLFLLLKFDVCLGYQREHGARAQLGQDARVRPWHHTKRAQDPLRMPDAMIDVHVHLPAGAQKKDAASAGVPMVRSPLFLSGFGAKMSVVGLM